MDAIEYIKGLQNKVDPSVTEGLETRFHFVLSGENGGDLTVVVDDGDIEVSDGLHGDPKCVVKSKASTFEKLLKKELNPMMAVMTGKVKISNQSELLKYAKVFGLM
ncbi:MAG: hydrogenase expression protein HypA [Bacteroidetes bacterium]|jgi:putative sterol carrier protein|nr:hydrogenase expression protein HypA [Bacteroidota bacterium]